MKTFISSIVLCAIVLLSACASTPATEPRPLEPTIKPFHLTSVEGMNSDKLFPAAEAGAPEPTLKSFRFTSIEGIKNGRYIINYLGEKLEGC